MSWLHECSYAVRCVVNARPFRSVQRCVPTIGAKHWLQSTVRQSACHSTDESIRIGSHHSSGVDRGESTEFPRLSHHHRQQFVFAVRQIWTRHVCVDSSHKFSQSIECHRRSMPWLCAHLVWTGEIAENLRLIWCEQWIGASNILQRWRRHR